MTMSDVTNLFLKLLNDLRSELEQISAPCKAPQSDGAIDPEWDSDQRTRTVALRDELGKKTIELRERLGPEKVRMLCELKRTITAMVSSLDSVETLSFEQQYYLYGDPPYYSVAFDSVGDVWKCVEKVETEFIAMPDEPLARIIHE